MNKQELHQRLSLEEKHFEWLIAELPRVDPGIYQTLGRQLFDLYEKYQVSPEDQRRFEALTWVLQGFVHTQRAAKPWWRRWI
jgi:hypothetical protein